MSLCCRGVVKKILIKDLKTESQKLRSLKKEKLGVGRINEFQMRKSKQPDGNLNIQIILML